jgi:outer membrane protein OmpA-like peptidoglycan-associated protein
MNEEYDAQQRALIEQREADANTRARLERDRAQAEEARRLQAENERLGAEAARAAAERARADAETAAAQLAQQQQAAEAARLAAEQARAAAELQAQQAQAGVAQADRERAELRERLRQQLNAVLETRETARGLIVNISDVLFDTGSANLKPGAREKLARVAGILLAQPGINVAVEGHTDSVGGTDYNQRLSERRGDSVRDYLVRQGIASGAVATTGYGESQPVASNTTAAGRQQNRRVELVVSGDAITTRTTTLTSPAR